MLFKGKFIEDKLVLSASHASVSEIIKSLIEYLNRFSENIQSEPFSGCIEIRMNEETILDAEDEALLHKEIEILNLTLQELKTGNENPIYVMLTEVKAPLKQPLKVKRETFDVFSYQDVAEERLKLQTEKSAQSSKEKPILPILIIILFIVAITVGLVIFLRQ